MVSKKKNIMKNLTNIQPQPQHQQHPQKGREREGYTHGVTNG